MKRNKTTLAISQALFRLLEKSNFDSITVNDICQECLVSRTTFYSYFEDKYQCVQFSLALEREHLGLVRGLDVEANFVAFLKSMRKQSRIYDNLFVSVANRELNTMLTDHLFLILETVLPQDIPTEERNILAQVYSGGIVFYIMRWIMDGCQTDETQIAQTIVKQIIK